MAKDKLFYVGQKAFIEKDGKVLVLFEPNLDIPGGKIQEGEGNSLESLREAIKREVKEETDLEIEVFDPFFVWTVVSTQYLGETIYRIGFRCKYISGEVKLSDEHDNFKWVDKNDYKELNDNSDNFKALEKYFEK